MNKSRAAILSALFVIPTFLTASATPPEELGPLRGVPADVQVEPDFNPEDGYLLVDGSGEETYVSPGDVSLDGTSVEGEAGTAAVCGSKIAVVPGTGTWYTTTDGCATIGITADATRGYEWGRYSYSGSACSQARGYRMYYGVYQPFWGGMGCGTSGGGYIAWGKVASVGKMKFVSTSVPVGLQVLWR